MTVKGIRTIFICCLCFSQPFVGDFEALFWRSHKMPYKKSTKLPRAIYRGQLRMSSAKSENLGVGGYWMVGL